MEDKRPQALTCSAKCRKRLQRRKERGQTGLVYVTVRELPPLPTTRIAHLPAIPESTPTTETVEDPFF
jgi:hypothetical protein